MMVDPQQNMKALEDELESRLEHLTPVEQQAVLAEALALLTIQDKSALLSYVTEALILAGHSDDAARIGLALQLYRDDPSA